MGPGGFTTRIDDVEWRGKAQLVYLGYELDPALEETLTEIEDALDFNLLRTSSWPSCRRARSSARA